MAKLLLLGIVLYSAIMPLLLSKTSSPKRTLRKIWLLHVLGVMVWSYLALRLYPVYAPLWMQIPDQW